MLRVDIDDGGIFTDTERTIFEKMAQGFTDKAIANQLKISAKTVGKHACSIYLKMEIQDNNQNARVRAIGQSIANGVMRITNG